MMLNTFTHSIKFGVVAIILALVYQRPIVLVSDNRREIIKSISIYWQAYSITYI